eukprot:TRINITY_DN39381_c0_g1_i1.p1 TRINITY_DN39381_c0_g1~~TRINITY_DN39381_c0_g1_i1.p1  ORF type:complete len:2044 (+),score=471.21 TRINITY_DN39381_c0_g1_i1:673-6132(+)
MAIGGQLPSGATSIRPGASWRMWIAGGRAGAPVRDGDLVLLTSSDGRVLVCTSAVPERCYLENCASTTPPSLEDLRRCGGLRVAGGRAGVIRDGDAIALHSEEAAAWVVCASDELQRASPTVGGRLCAPRSWLNGAADECRRGSCWDRWRFVARQATARTALVHGADELRPQPPSAGAVSRSLQRDVHRVGVAALGLGADDVWDIVVSDRPLADGPEEWSLAEATRGCCGSSAGAVAIRVRVRTEAAELWSAGLSWDDFAAADCNGTLLQEVADAADCARLCVAAASEGCVAAVSTESGCLLYSACSLVDGCAESGGWDGTVAAVHGGVSAPALCRELCSDAGCSGWEWRVPGAADELNCVLLSGQVTAVSDDSAQRGLPNCSRTVHYVRPGRLLDTAERGVRWQAAEAGVACWSPTVLPAESPGACAQACVAARCTEFSFPAFPSALGGCRFGAPTCTSRIEVAPWSTLWRRSVVDAAGPFPPAYHLDWSGGEIVFGSGLTVGVGTMMRAPVPVGIAALRASAHVQHFGVNTANFTAAEQLRVAQWTDAAVFSEQTLRVQLRDDVSSASVVCRGRGGVAGVGVASATVSLPVFRAQSRGGTCSGVGRGVYSCTVEIPAAATSLLLSTDAAKEMRLLLTASPSARAECDLAGDLTTVEVAVDAGGDLSTVRKGACGQLMEAASGTRLDGQPRWFWMTFGNGVSVGEGHAQGSNTFLESNVTASAYKYVHVWGSADDVFTAAVFFDPQVRFGAQSLELRPGRVEAVEIDLSAPAPNGTAVDVECAAAPDGLVRLRTDLLGSLDVGSGWLQLEPLAAGEGVVSCWPRYDSPPFFVSSSNVSIPVVVLASALPGATLADSVLVLPRDTATFAHVHLGGLSTSAAFHPPPVVRLRTGDDVAAVDAGAAGALYSLPAFDSATCSLAFGVDGGGIPAAVSFERPWQSTFSLALSFHASSSGAVCSRGDGNLTCCPLVSSDYDCGVDGAVRLLACDNADGSLRVRFELAEQMVELFCPSHGWHQVLAARSPKSGFILWLDGRAADSAAAGAPGCGNVRVGVSDTNGTAFAGNMRDVRFWSRTVSHAQAFGEQPVPTEMLRASGDCDAVLGTGRLGGAVPANEPTSGEAAVRCLVGDTDVARIDRYVYEIPYGAWRAVRVRWVGPGRTTLRCQTTGYHANGTVAAARHSDAVVVCTDAAGWAMLPPPPVPVRAGCAAERLATLYVSAGDGLLAFDTGSGQWRAESGAAMLLPGGSCRWVGARLLVYGVPRPASYGVHSGRWRAEVGWDVLVSSQQGGSAATTDDGDGLWTVEGAAVVKMRLSTRRRAAVRAPPAAAAPATAGASIARSHEVCDGSNRTWVYYFGRRVARVDSRQLVWSLQPGVDGAASPPVGAAAANLCGGVAFVGGLAPASGNLTVGAAAGYQFPSPGTWGTWVPVAGLAAPVLSPATAAAGGGVVAVGGTPTSSAFNCLYTPTTVGAVEWLCSADLGEFNEPAAVFAFRWTPPNDTLTSVTGACTRGGEAAISTSQWPACVDECMQTAGCAVVEWPSTGGACTLLRATACASHDADAATVHAWIGLRYSAVLTPELCPGGTAVPSSNTASWNPCLTDVTVQMDVCASEVRASVAGAGGELLGRAVVDFGDYDSEWRFLWMRVERVPGDGSLVRFACGTGVTVGAAELLSADTEYRGSLPRYAGFAGIGTGGSIWVLPRAAEAARVAQWASIDPQLGGCGAAGACDSSEGTCVCRNPTRWGTACQHCRVGFDGGGNAPCNASCPTELGPLVQADCEAWRSRGCKAVASVIDVLEPLWLPRTACVGCVVRRVRLNDP